MFQILWAFETSADRAAAFQQAYGPEGVWVEFFRQGRGYRDTELFRSTADAVRFLTLDRWDSRAAYEAFRRERATDYARLDAACAGLTVREEFLGSWGT